MPINNIINKIIVPSWQFIATIIVVLFAGGVFITYKYNVAHDAALSNTTKYMIEELSKAVEEYKSKFGTYPSTSTNITKGDDKYYAECLLSSKLPKSSILHGWYFNNSMNSAYNRPIYYMYSKDRLKGPDGNYHDNVAY